MKLTKRQREVLEILAENGRAFIDGQYADYRLHIIPHKRFEGLSYKTMDIIRGAGFIKNIGSHQYKEYTISEAGLRAIGRKPTIIITEDRTDGDED